MKVVDTDSVGFNDTSGGSRTTFATGLAAHELGKKMQQQMADGRRRFLGSGRRPRLWSTGSIYSANGERLTFREIAKIMGDGGRAGDGQRVRHSQ